MAEKTVIDYLFESRGKKTAQLRDKLLSLGFEITDYSYIVKHKYDEYGKVILVHGKTIVKFVTEQYYQWKEPKCHLYINDYCLWESPEPLRFTDLIKKIKKFRKEG